MSCVGLVERLGVRFGLRRLARLGEAVVELLAATSSRAASASVGQVAGPEQVRRRLAVAERDRGELRPEEGGVVPC